MTRLAPLAAAAALALAGCGLFEDAIVDATTFSVDTGWRTFTVDASSFGLAGSGTLPFVPCSSGQRDACAKATSIVRCGGGPYQCQVVCGGRSCDLSITLELGQKVDVAAKLRSRAAARAVSKAVLEQVAYKVSENSLTLDTPQVDLYVAPADATSSADRRATLFARMPRIAAGTRPSGRMTVTTAGKVALAAAIRNYTRPFKFLARIPIAVRGGQRLPAGRLRVALNAVFKIALLK